MLNTNHCGRAILPKSRGKYLAVGHGQRTCQWERIEWGDGRLTWRNSEAKAVVEGGGNCGAASIPPHHYVSEDE